MIPTVFWVSAGWIGYTYAGYPMAIAAIAKLRPKPSFSRAIEPTVSVVLAAHNEAARIGRKLENLLALDYPRDKLQIIVVSDGSKDGTANVVREFADRGVELEVLDNVCGKPTALNAGVARARGELLLFCDTRQHIGAAALRALVPHFADSSVGAVSGELQLDSVKGPGAYWKYEKSIRSAEGKFDSVPGATGALYAIRRTLFHDVPADCLLDDVYTPMRIVLEGRRVLFEPDAKAYDSETDLDGEFQRKARTLAGNYQLLHQLPGILDPRKNRILWQFASHKLARLGCPVAMTSLLGASVVLAVKTSPARPLYALALGAQLVAYGLAARGALRGERAGRLEKLAHTFVVLNAAAVEGLRRYLTGELTWTTANRGQGSSPR